VLLELLVDLYRTTRRHISEDSYILYLFDLTAIVHWVPAHPLHRDFLPEVGSGLSTRSQGLRTAPVPFVMLVHSHETTPPALYRFFLCQFVLESFTKTVDIV
jgi:hypothetical protein